MLKGTLGAIVVLAVAGLAAAQLPLPLEGGAPHGSIAAGPASPEGLAAWVAQVEEATRTKADEPSAPAGLRGLAALAQAQPPQPDQNATNQTVIPGYGNGTNTHYHGNVGDQGLGAVWASVFHGVPQAAVPSDLDGDGTLDVVLGTDLSVTAISGKTGNLLWARHIGSSVTSLFAFEGDGQDGPEIGYSTLWEGQTPRIGVVDGRTGAVQWEHVGARPYLIAAAALADGTAASDVLAVDTDGVHARLSAASGEPVWEFDVDLLPDDLTNGVAPGTVYANEGQYLAEAADVNGDGVTDTISVGAYMYAAGFNQYALIQAVDGATGARLWITNVGGDPHVIAQAIVYDIEALDTQGDGSADLAYSFLALRYDAFSTLLFYWEQGWRVTKGDSTAAGIPIASHTVVTPVLPLDLYPDLDHTDVDGDGRHELAVLHQLVVVNSLLNGDDVTYERFAMPLGSTSDPTLLALSDVVVGAGSTGRISSFDLDGDGAAEHGITRVVDGNATWTVVTDDGQVLGPFDTGSLGVQAAAGLGEQVAVATRGALELRSATDLAAVASLFPLRGAPMRLRLADADEDGTPDLYVLGTDGAIHLIDGVTGIGVRSIAVGPGAIDFQVAALGGSPAPDLLVARGEDEGAFGYGNGMDAWDGETGKRLYARDPDFDGYYLRDMKLWFDGDGDGDRDLIVGWSVGDNVLTAANGRNGRELWAKAQDLGDTGTLTDFRRGAVANVDGSEGDDLLMESASGLLVVDGRTGRTLGWHPLASEFGVQPGITCMGGADGDGDGRDTIFAVHAGSAGDLARSLDNGTWSVLGWVPDESQVARCDLRAVPNGDGTQDLLVSMVWVQADGSVFARIGRWDGGAGSWVWEDVQRRPDVETQAYFAFGVAGGPRGTGRVFLAWQDHAYSLAWDNGSLIGEFTVNGPFVMSGDALDLDGAAPAEAVLLAADGLVWAVAEDRGLVAQRLAQKADDQGKESNYGAGSSFAAPPPPPPKKDKKSFIPGPPLALLAAALAVAAVARARRGNR